MVMIIIYRIPVTIISYVAFDFVLFSPSLQRIMWFCMSLLLIDGLANRSLDTRTHKIANGKLLTTAKKQINFRN